MDLPNQPARQVRPLARQRVCGYLVAMTGVDVERG